MDRKEIKRVILAYAILIMVLFSFFVKGWTYAAVLVLIFILSYWFGYTAKESEK